MRVDILSATSPHVQALQHQRHGGRHIHADPGTLHAVQHHERRSLNAANDGFADSGVIHIFDIRQRRDDGGDHLERGLQVRGGTAPTNPASTKRRIIAFLNDGASTVELFRSRDLPDLLHRGDQPPVFDTCGVR